MKCGCGALLLAGILLAFCPAGLNGLGAQAEARPVPAEIHHRLARTARELARKGFAAEAGTVVGILSDLGFPEKEAEALRKKCAGLAPKRAVSPGKRRGLLRQLDGTVTRLARFMARAGKAERKRIAQALLALDVRQPDAHRALGHVKRQDCWLSPQMARAAERRRAFLGALQKARSLEVKVTTHTCTEAQFRGLGFDPPAEARFRGIRIYGNFEKAMLREILVEAVRAYAYSSFVRDGKLSLPPDSLEFRYFFVRHKKNYLLAIRNALEHRWIDRKAAAKAPDRLDFYVASGLAVGQFSTFADGFSSLVYDLSSRGWKWDAYGGLAQPCLFVGHLNWICMSYLGVQLPHLAESDPEVTVRPPRYAGDPSTIERESKRRMAKAGITGSRAWMRYLVREGQDPSWSHAMVEDSAVIKSEVLLKATFVVEYLQEIDGFVPLVKRTVSKERIHREPMKILTLALGEPLAAFEARWRQWFMPVSGIRQRVASTGPLPVSEDIRRTVAYLNEIRRAAWKCPDLGDYVPVIEDTALSRGCLCHARYLNRHPAQAAAWPDAHEEYPDRDLFSVEGNWAGLHSVIAPGVRGPREAIDGWIGTFYHRLPLLEAGLVRIGWGMDQRLAVLDSGSIVDTSPRYGWIAWPHEGMKDVPRTFVPELPNPIPGQDQAKFGYPVTLQRFEKSERVKMRLLQGKQVVDCYFLTPENPVNLDLAPARAYCLIPKHHLKAGTSYRVTATIEGGECLAWSFRTRR